MARLDRLGPAKEVAQIGAVIGREFSHALLAAVSRKDEGQLKSALDGLVLAGLLFRQGLPSNASYLFKHALVQDAAYGTLLREPRRALHKRIAETLESKFSEIGESQPELLARHYSNAELIEKAAWLWGKAGERSLARSAVVEACEQLSRALDQIATLPQTGPHVASSSSFRSPSQTRSCRSRAMQLQNPRPLSSRRACLWSELKPSARHLRTHYSCFHSFGACGAQTTSDSTARRLRI
jgi:hypothetical protein